MDPTTQQQPTQPTQQAPTPPTADGNEGLGSFEQNLSRIQEEVRQENLRASEAERGQPTEQTHAAPTQAQPTDDARAQAAAERRERLAQVQAATRAKLEAKRAREERYRLPDELSARDRRIAELESQMQGYVPREHFSDPLAALRLLEDAGVPADKLAEAIRQRMTDPELYAAHAAQRAVDPKLSALEKKLAAQEAVIANFLAEQQRREAAYEAQQQTHAFLNTVAQSGGIAARFLATDGPEKFMRIVERASERLPDGAGEQALLDQIEEILDTDGRRIYQQMAAIYGPLGPTPSNGTRPPPNPAAAQATTTVTNSIAQERASVVTDDDPMAGMSFDERVRYLSRQL